LLWLFKDLAIAVIVRLTRKDGCSLIQDQTTNENGTLLSGVFRERINELRFGLVEVHANRVISDESRVSVHRSPKKKPTGQGVGPWAKDQAPQRGDWGYGELGGGSFPARGSSPDLRAEVGAFAVTEVKVESLDVLDAGIDHATSRDPVERRAVDSCVFRYGCKVCLSQALYNVAVD
jgi:hypothetical protein